MSNPFRSLRGAHRPDKHSRRTERMVRAHISTVLMELCADPLTLLEVVGGGYDYFKRAVTEAFHPYPLGDDVPAMMFKFCCAQVMKRFHTSEFSTDATAYHVAKTTLDRVEEHAGPTEAEIRAAWKVEDFSSEEGRRTLYGTDDPQQHLNRVIQEMHDDGRG